MMAAHAGMDPFSEVVVKQWVRHSKLQNWQDHLCPAFIALWEDDGVRPINWNAPHPKLPKFDDNNSSTTLVGLPSPKRGLCFPVMTPNKAPGPLAHGSCLPDSHIWLIISRAAMGPKLIFFAARI